MSKKLMTFKEYAEYKNVHLQSVYRWAHKGKLDGCITTGKRNRKINIKKADKSISENLDRIYNKPTRVYKKKNSPGKNKTKVNIKKKSTPEDDKKKIIKSAGLNIVSLSEAQKLKENYLAALRKLEYKTKRRELLQYDEVRKAFADMVLSARSKILSIKGLLAPLLKEFVDDPKNFGTVMENIEIVIRDVLTEMSENEIKR